jgi:hypothetical protein
MDKTLKRWNHAIFSEIVWAFRNSSREITDNKVKTTNLITLRTFSYSKTDLTTRQSLLHLQIHT